MQPDQELIDELINNYGFTGKVECGFIGHNYDIKENPLKLSSKEIEYFYTHGISEHEAEKILILEIKQGIK